MSFYRTLMILILLIIWRRGFSLRIILLRVFLDRDNSFYRPYYKAVCFYKVYSKLFSDDFILSAEYVTHWIDVDMAHQTNKDLLDIAEKLVRKYAKAKMVVTSRIHAGYEKVARYSIVLGFDK